MMTGFSKNRVTTGVLGVLVALVCANSALGQVIRLSEKAVVEARQDVRLGNIATVTGVDAATAASLADTVVLPNVQSRRTIRAESVLMAVVAQLGGNDVGNRLQLAGSAECTIEIETPGARPAIAAAAQVVVATPVMPVAPVVAPLVVVPAMASPSVVTASVVSEAAAPADANSLRNLIMERLKTEISSTPNDLSVDFQTENKLLDAAVPEGAAWQFQPLTRTFLGTVMWRADLVQNSRVLQKLSIETRVQKHVKVLVAAKQIASGSILSNDQCVMEDALIDRNMPTLCTDVKEILGLEAVRGIVVGSQLDQRDFKPVQMAEQGGSVTVIFVSGNLKAKMSGRALQNGKLHDQIGVRNEQTRQDYQATLIGKRLAVVGSTLTEAQEESLREAQ